MGYSTALLDEAIAKRRKAREELRVRQLEKLQHALDALSREIAFEEAYMFGSIAEPFGFSEGSDIDVGFMGLRDEDFFAAMSFLSNQLSAEVDVIQLESHRFGDKIRRFGTRWKKKE
jgi:uncharacterized protein